MTIKEAAILDVHQPSSTKWVAYFSTVRLLMCMQVLKLVSLPNVLDARANLYRIYETTLDEKNRLGKDYKASLKMVTFKAVRKSIRNRSRIKILYK